MHRLILDISKSYCLYYYGYQVDWDRYCHRNGQFLVCYILVDNIVRLFHSLYYYYNYSNVSYNDCNCNEEKNNSEEVT